MATLFDETTLRKLEQLTLVADRVRVGMMKGDRRSAKRGTSIEFADFRNYTRGDDLRRLDWNVFARLERPFIKLLEEEEDLAVHLLVDASKSMDWPETGETDESDPHKLNFALRVAGALGHISLATGDNVNVTLIHSRDNERWGPSRGKQNSLRLLNFLDQREGGGITDLNGALREYALRGGRPGLAFILSDLLSPDGYQGGVDALLSRGYEVGLIHILSPDEQQPEASGDMKLIDVETGAESEITLDQPTLELYLQRMQEWQGEIAAYCSARQVHYIPVTSDMPWDRLILQTLRQKGVVR